VTSAVIVGARGSGLTTFIGLLYTAQVRFGTEAGDEFRFHVERETLQQLNEIYGELGAGRFPTHDVDWDEHSLSFVLSFRASRLLRWRRPGRNAEGSGNAQVRVGGITTEELAELREHDAVVGESTRLLFHSPVVLPLVDASRLRVEDAGSPTSSPAGYDAQLAATLDLLAKYLSTEPERKAREMHPLFVLTKFDLCPAATRDRLGAPAGPVAAWSEEVRRAVGQRILERCLPRTGAFLAASDRASPVRIAPPRWYFSSLRVEEGGEVPHIARRSRAPVGGWEPEYPYEEYRALIERLGQLARHLPDAAER
jgi:hypothetical protein